MTEGKSVGGEAPSAPFGYSTVLVLLGKWTTIYMTEGKSVGGEPPSARFGYCTILLLIGKWITIDMTEDKSVDCKASTPQCVGKCWGTYSCEVCTWGG